MAALGCNNHIHLALLALGRAEAPDGDVTRLAPVGIGRRCHVLTYTISAASQTSLMSQKRTPAPHRSSRKFSSRTWNFSSSIPSRTVLNYGGTAASFDCSDLAYLTRELWRNVKETGRRTSVATRSTGACRTCSWSFACSVRVTNGSSGRARGWACWRGPAKESLRQTKACRRSS